MTSPTPIQPPRPGFVFNPRVALILVGLLLFVAATVVATDHFSPRDRTPPSTASSAPAATGASR